MIPPEIKKEQIIKAIKIIDSEGISPQRKSRKFFLIFKGKQYPPKYVLSLAYKFVDGKKLDTAKFNGGRETNNFLKKLGFDIVEMELPKKNNKLKLSKKKDFLQTQQKHSENCSECKNTIQKMLEKIYGDVRREYKFKLNTKIENFKNFKFYQNLKEIFIKLQKHRGYEDFIKRATLSTSDYFIPNPGFIVEYDESQHFTTPRKISLQNYPRDLKIGFSLEKWIDLCDKLNRTDNDPPSRDEQRAWYDTLRDFLPEFKRINPTVRLYSKEKQWCNFNPENKDDLAKFKKLIEKNQNKFESWVATVILQSNENHSKEERMKILSMIFYSIVEKTEGDGVIVFPGGWFNTNNHEARKLYNYIEEKIKNLLNKDKRNIIIVLGIDGRITTQYPKDQIGIAINKNGISSIGRKFYAAPQEKGKIISAENYNSKEERKLRYFELNGKRYFLCVCYDSYGIRKEKIPNELDIDIILNLVHGFWPRSKGPSGDSYFARHGFAGASKQWDCLVFGAAVFFNREIPKIWPSGVYWDQGTKSTREWRYEYNPIKPARILEKKIKEGLALIRIFNLM